jgi:hypothetical protein
LRGLPGTYLWQTIALASGYAAPLGDDIWVVECSGIPLEFGGPHSIHPGERWTPHPIPRERLLGRLPRHASRQPTEKPPEVCAAIVARRGQPRKLALVVIPANGVPVLHRVLMCQRPERMAGSDANPAASAYPPTLV